MFLVAGCPQSDTYIGEFKLLCFFNRVMLDSSDLQDHRDPQERRAMKVNVDLLDHSGPKVTP